MSRTEPRKVVFMPVVVQSVSWYSLGIRGNLLHKLECLRSSDIYNTGYSLLSNKKIIVAGKHWATPKLV